MLHFLFPPVCKTFSVCVFNITRSCYKLASMCAHQNVCHVSMKTGKCFTLLNHLSSWVCVWIMCGICVKDVCEGQRLGICEGRYTVGLLDENAGGIEKKIVWTIEDVKILSKDGERWQGYTFAPHVCHLAVSPRSDPTLSCMTSGHSWPWSFL